MIIVDGGFCEYTVVANVSHREISPKIGGPVVFCQSDTLSDSVTNYFKAFSFCYTSESLK